MQRRRKGMSPVIRETIVIALIFSLGLFMGVIEQKIYEVQTREDESVRVVDENGKIVKLDRDKVKIKDKDLESVGQKQFNPKKKSIWVTAIIVFFIIYPIYLVVWTSMAKAQARRRKMYQDDDEEDEKKPQT